MFNPTSARDRINYGKILVPPAGFKLERAVGTTYSLDLETLTAVAIALGLIEDTDSELIGNPISLISAFHKVADKITVFCEAGQIKLPSKPNALCLILEKMVVPVALPFDSSIKRYPAFHPKTWLLEYSSANGEKKYRFVVLSRNMTFDHSWDVACSLDGSITVPYKTSSENLRSFLVFLRDKLNKNLINYERQKNDLDYFIQRLPAVGFQVEEGFDKCEILPMGIGTGSYDMLSDRLFKDCFRELLVMSPFLTDSVISILNEKKGTLPNTSMTLITRKSELSCLKRGSASNFDIYVMKDGIIDGESAISDGEDPEIDSAITEDNKELLSETYRKQDIHAKIYIVSDESKTNLYIGSMNASYAALKSNVEMMLKLETKSSIFNGKMFIDDVMGGKNPFELVYPDEFTANDGSSEAEKIIKKICRINMSATVVYRSTGYCIRVTAEVKAKMDDVFLRPLRCNKECNLLHLMEFDSLALLDLSEFYVVSVKNNDSPLERVIMIPTFGIPDTRESEIVRSVIKTKNQFIEIVAFILGDDYVQSFLENKKMSRTYAAGDDYSLLPAVYEKMLRSSVTAPDRIAEIQYIMRAIEEKNIIPEEFREMYDVFCDTLGINRE